MVDEADLLAAAEAAGVEQAVCACSEKCVVGAVNTECAVCSVNMGKCVGAAPEPIAVISGRLSCPLIRRMAYCSEACARITLRRQKREYMRKKRR